MCEFYENKHVFKKELSPACGKTCKACHGRNHFSVKCKKINMVERNVYDESSNGVNSLNSNNNSLTTVMNVNNCDVRFQLDSGCANQYHSEEICS